MKILVTGATGFIGKNSFKHFESSGHEVTAWHRHQDLSSLLEAFRPECVLNCAAEIYDEKKMFYPNIYLVQVLLDYCKESGARLIHFGSSSEYGSVNKITAEDTLPQPDTVYGATKLAATNIVVGTAKQHNIDAVVLRLYSPFGPGERPHRLFPNFWKAAKLEQPMTLVNGVHDFTYIEDVVSAVQYVFSTGHAFSGQVYNICNSEQYTNFEIHFMFELLSQKELPVTRDEKWVTPKIWTGDNTLFRQTFNWAPKYTIYDGIQEFLEHGVYE